VEVELRRYGADHPDVVVVRSRRTAHTLIGRFGLFLGCLLAGAQSTQAGEFWKPFIAGAASGFAIHEGSHLLLDLTFDTKPRLTGVHFGPIPFFALTHSNNTPPDDEALISGAGFFSQHVTSEVIMTLRKPGAEVSAFDKGLLAFHLATSLGYAGAAFFRYGPEERDTRGIAASTNTDERLVGALVLAPAVFDTWRYLRPQSKAVRIASRVSKAAFLGVVVFKR
jgi:hypothetical protein